jgi:uncharacterized protein (DUF608 family)
MDLFKTLVKRFRDALCLLQFICAFPLLAADPIAETFDAMSFRNVGVVTRDMEFVALEHDSHYNESDDQWFTKKFGYCYERKAGKNIAPPSGIRSSVPLGGLGAGTVELRGDGRFADWNIFNNAPASGDRKIQLDEAFMGLRTQAVDGDAFATTLRTHPPSDLPAIESIEYNGAFPVSRLRFHDRRLPIQATLYAYSEFHPRQSDRSATPCVLLSLALHNPSEKPIDADFLLQLPNQIDGEFRGRDALMLSKQGTASDAGDMTLAAIGADQIIPVTGDASDEIWNRFAAGEVKADDGVTDRSVFGGIAASARIEPRQTRVITIALAWYFPHRKHFSEVIGNHYTTLFESSSEVAETALGRLPETLQGIDQWHRSCLDNSLPNWLQDSLVNSAATMFKTSLWAADGRFRQYESFACSNMEPIHITFARSLPYDLFFPDLERNILAGFAKFQLPDGYIQEKLCGRDKSQKPFGLDAPPANGRILGDTCTTFILSVYKSHRWSDNESFARQMWPAVKKAAQWQINRSESLGLPNRIASTYDLSNFQSKDLISYNAFMHIAALQATIELAQSQGDTEFADRCRSSLNVARETLVERLWTGEFFRNWWHKGKPSVDLIHVDTLFGQLWCSVLGLDECIEPKLLRSHLQSERKFCDTPYGLEVITDTEAERDPSRRTINDTVWQGGSFTHAALSLFVGNDVDESLELAERVANHWRTGLNDQWSYNDLTTAWNGDPWCNAHYGRQLIFWTIPMALSGQDYSAVDGRLAFSPRNDAPYRLSFYTPAANGVLNAAADGSLTIELLSGELDISELVVSGSVFAVELSMKAGDVEQLGEVVANASVPDQAKGASAASNPVERMLREACRTLNLDFDEVFTGYRTAPYERYRWSTTLDEAGLPIIHALPPEEEMGWTPWERWSMKDGGVVHSNWVQFPIKNPVKRGVVRWYSIDENDALVPRFATKCDTLEEQLRRARVDVAADWLGLDFVTTFLKPLSPQIQRSYQSFRWVVIPHVLAADGPVIYALPPVGRSDDLPWESWYTDGTTPRIHHVHYTARKPESTGQWSERADAPQRPPEIYDHLWFWHDDPKMLPALLK